MVTPLKCFRQRLLRSLSRELLSWLVSPLSTPGHLDLVSRDFPFVEKRNVVSIETDFDSERNLVSADLAIGDWIVPPLHSRHSSSQLVTFHLEVEGRFAGLAITSRNLSGPFTIHIRRPSQRQGGKYETYGEKHSSLLH